MQFKILIVGETGAKYLENINNKQEYHLLHAKDNIEALELLEQNGALKLVILDLPYPDMNNESILERLKTDNKYKDIQSIIITNRNEELLCMDCLTKPVKTEILKSRIELNLELISAREALLQESKEQNLIFDAVFNQIPLGISVSYNADANEGDINQHFRCNPAFEKITGRSKEELAGLGWKGITHPDDIEENLTAIEKLKNGEIENYTLEKRYIRPDGSIVWVNLLGAKLDLSTDNPYNHIALVQDITDRKK